MQKEKIESLFLSDLHLGSFHAVEKAKKIIDILNKYDANNLFLVGDIVDFKELSESFMWTKECSQVFEMFSNFPNVFYITGNHERGFLDNANIQIFKNFRIISSYYVYKDFYICHGDKIDIALCKKIFPSQFLEILNNDYFEEISKKLFSSLCKEIRRDRLNYLIDFRNMAIKLYRSLGAKGIICGHTHHQEYYDNYYNIGDFKHNSTYMIETTDENFELKNGF